MFLNKSFATSSKIKNTIQLIEIIEPRFPLVNPDEPRAVSRDCKRDC